MHKEEKKQKVFTSLDTKCTRYVVGSYSSCRSNSSTPVQPTTSSYCNSYRALTSILLRRLCATLRWSSAVSSLQRADMFDLLIGNEFWIRYLFVFKKTRYYNGGFAFSRWCGLNGSFQFSFSIEEWITPFRFLVSYNSEEKICILLILLHLDTC